jgi:phosphoribosylaminoimidazole-succinocarboxamide synthase
MGSVKDLRIIEQPTATRAGKGQFYFSDRYSVFDWGEMPDQLTHKGKALCTIGAFFFEKLEDLGIKTHYQGVILNNSVKRLDEIDEPVDTMQVSLVRVIKPDNKNGVYDYSMYSQREKNFLIPLEVIYRNSLPEGSSIFRRLKNGSLKLDDIGLKSMPSPNDSLSEPILDVSTKLEITDRYMSWKEAQQISAISDSELETILETTKKINNLISEQVKSPGLVNEDGKVEYAYDANRNLMLVDILGTPDECRFTYQGMQVSKQIARDFYRKTPWYQMTEDAKQRDRENWKKKVEAPPKLPQRLYELISQLYQSSCNEITGKEWFDVPSLKSILNEIQEQISA